MSEASDRFADALEALARETLGSNFRVMRGEYYVKEVAFDIDHGFSRGFGLGGLPILDGEMNIRIMMSPTLYADPPRPERPSYTHESTAEEIRELPETRKLLTTGEHHESD
jgi:hypothetical protein